MSQRISPDGDVIKRIEVVKHCEACGLQYAPIVEIDGSWHCDNCGADASDFEVVR